ncbi:purine nucleoside phosphorylase YfiH [Candidatus Fukatsuia symbiotica]|uniref:Purine nucleoside phosphorylase n=1 Tax=Candidatus Fukatsuia symbiotica TaxID=1878942 RepID=A0A2U8I454_9GAMM|nr:purine nucleoside phosphorylase YfiH [Candidatus Fukatsuia symbiotica]AWK13921.1 hypothetical protein CCS41_04620 [Candidatus Fukatsuia symbiotica]MEA9445738.1 purine nucleoside phosphorylase YfiH [Candidatus Fukatsuia symbiotica]
MSFLIIPDWPVPVNIKAYSTTRHGGVSQSPYDSLNLSTQVGDDPASVAANRQRLKILAKLPQIPIWPHQVHGTHVLHLTHSPPSSLDLQADAVYSNTRGQICAVMTADCLPVLLCSLDGNEIAAVHAGWRGLCAGVLENTLAQFHAKPDTIIAWLGAAISAQQFIVGEEVKQTFINVDEQSTLAFTPYGTKYFADIYLLARLRLQTSGIHAIYDGNRCTMTESQQFFSYRRQAITGRMASLIWRI